MTYTPPPAQMTPLLAGMSSKKQKQQDSKILDDMVRRDEAWAAQNKAKIAGLPKAVQDAIRPHLGAHEGKKGDFVTGLPKDQTRPQAGPPVDNSMTPPDPGPDSDIEGKTTPWDHFAWQNRKRGI